MPDDTPYCGTPPLPGDMAWNADPVLLAALAALGAFGLSRGRDAAHRLTWLCGWAVLVLALVSPLCNLSVALFGARAGQHMLLVLCAAPLLALGLRLRLRRLGPPAFAFAIALWGWHLPGPYAATFRGDAIAYWAMHLTTIGAALWLWSALIHRLADRPDAVALAGLATTMQMGVLGALISLAPRAIYAPHTVAVTLPWGFTPLEDQQLGGLLMWVPGGLLFVVLMVAGLSVALRRVPAEARIPIAPRA